MKVPNVSNHLYVGVLVQFASTEHSGYNAPGTAPTVKTAPAIRLMEFVMAVACPALVEKRATTVSLGHGIIHSTDKSLIINMVNKNNLLN